MSRKQRLAQRNISTAMKWSFLPTCWRLFLKTGVFSVQTLRLMRQHSATVASLLTRRRTSKCISYLDVKLQQKRKSPNVRKRLGFITGSISYLEEHQQSQSTRLIVFLQAIASLQALQPKISHQRRILLQPKISHQRSIILQPKISHQRSIILLLKKILTLQARDHCLPSHYQSQKSLFF